MKKLENFLTVVLTSLIIGTIVGIIGSVLVKPFLDILEMGVTYTQLAIVLGVIGFCDTIPKAIKLIEA